MPGVCRTSEEKGSRLRASVWEGQSQVVLASEQIARGHSLLARAWDGDIVNISPVALHSSDFT